MSNDKKPAVEALSLAACIALFVVIWVLAESHGQNADEVMTHWLRGLLQAVVFGTALYGFIWAVFSTKRSPKNDDAPPFHVVDSGINNGKSLRQGEPPALSDGKADAHLSRVNED